jgi:hypothetical protein
LPANFKFTTELLSGVRSEAKTRHCLLGQLVLRLYDFDQESDAPPDLPDGNAVMVIRSAQNMGAAL